MVRHAEGIDIFSGSCSIIGDRDRSSMVFKYLDTRDSVAWLRCYINGDLIVVIGITIFQGIISISIVCHRIRANTCIIRLGDVIFNVSGCHGDGNVVCGHREGISAGL